jgi:hypothetical protein
MAALKQIRLHCLECVGSAHEVKLCQVLNCKLFEYRLGKSNRPKKELTDEQRQVIAERFRLAREAKK